MALIAPKVVVTLGNFATRLLLDTDQGITKVRGPSYPMGAAQLVPTFHPAAALRGGGVVLAQMRADLVRAKQLMGLAHVTGPSSVLADHLGRTPPGSGRRPGRPLRARRRPAALRRPRGRQDDLRPGLRPGPRRRRAGHQPHLHPGPPLRGARPARPGCARCCTPTSTGSSTWRRSPTSGSASWSRTAAWPSSSGGRRPSRSSATGALPLLLEADPDDEDRRTVTVSAAGTSWADRWDGAGAAPWPRGRRPGEPAGRRDRHRPGRAPPCCADDGSVAERSHLGRPGPRRAAGPDDRGGVRPGRVPARRPRGPGRRHRSRALHRTAGRGGDGQGARPGPRPRDPRGDQPRRPGRRGPASRRR